MLGGLIAAGLLLFFLLLTHFYRSRRSPQLELKSNCLLTTHPIVFLSGRQSLFYFLKYWNWIPEQLSLHGYEVRILDLHWRDSEKRLQQINQFLNSLTSKDMVHIVGDSSSRTELRAIQELNHSRVLSTYLVEVDDTKRTLSREDLRPQKNFIQSFSFKPSTPQSSLRSLTSFTALFCRIHNRIRNPKEHVQPTILGAGDPRLIPSLRDFYLNLAIHIAETDLERSTQQ